MKQIALTQGKFALVDDKDLEWLNQWKWFAKKNNNNYYAVRSSKWPKQRHIFMHRVIINAPNDKYVDHANLNGLDNRRSNIRLCTNSQNVRNQRITKTRGTSQYRGVSWDSKVKKWRACIVLECKLRHLGYYKSEHRAAIVYNDAAKELFGEFSRLNCV